MPLGVCLISTVRPEPDPLKDLLQRCGFLVWTPSSPDADDGHIYDEAVCLVIDLPGEAGARTLKLLRDYGVKTPAVLVVDCGYRPMPDELGSPWTLNITPSPVDPRELLRWIETMCITRKLLERIEAGGRVARLSA